MMFAAMATIAAEKCRNKIEIIRTSQIPEEYSPTTIAGDVGMGIYDHHSDIDGTPSIGSQNNTQDYVSAACGLLYQDVKDILFPGDSETKKVFEAFIDIIEHCDNTADNNTFSDSVNYLAPIDDDQADEAWTKAMLYCKAVVVGFIEAHDKERGGKIWAVPRVCGGIVPGVAEKRDQRYWKATNQIKNRYKYVSFNDKLNMKLRSMDTYSLACGVLNQRKRQYWREEIETSDANQIKEMERREREDWPEALANMKHKTIQLKKYLPYGPYVKDISALFIVLPSQRGGYTVNMLKTNTGKFRFDPNMLIGFQGCSFVANDKRFLFFETEEQALAAAHAAGQTVSQYLELNGFDAYRDIYGGCKDKYTGDMYQDLISEDIAFNIFARDNVKDINNMSVAEYRMLQIAAIDNPYLIHSFCTHFKATEDAMIWDSSVSVIDMLSGEKKSDLLTKNRDGRQWNVGLENFLKTPAGQDALLRVYPNR
jgi:hypothetical protein